MKKSRRPIRSLNQRSLTNSSGRYLLLKREYYYNIIEQGLNVPVSFPTKIYSGENMKQIAQVLVNIPSRSINKPFSYAVPEEMNYITTGWRVLVPFGPRRVEGFVMNVTAGDPAGLKSILNTIDDEVWFDDSMLKTAAWISDYYFCPLAEALRLFIPGKSGIKSQKIYRLADNNNEGQITCRLKNHSEDCRRLAAYLLQNGSATMTKLKELLGTKTKNVIQTLLKEKIIAATVISHTTARPKYQQQVRLAVAEEAAASSLLTEFKNKPAQRRLLQALIKEGTLNHAQLKHLDISRDAVQRLVKNGMIAIDKLQVWRNSYSNIKSICTPPSLTRDQEAVLKPVLNAVKDKIFSSFLLHGVTGSGKTQVYIEAVEAVRRQGRQAIVLVPEIALTNQIVMRFQAQFGEDVVVIHSKLSVAERSDAWLRLKSNQAGIVIGARSAIFAPLTDIGIIIIDEEHEFPYKQEESPRYDTRRVAQIRAQLADAVVILGSATPSIETYYNALQKNHILLTMPKRIDGATMPVVEIVDMREELQKGRRGVISLPLQKLLSQTFSRNEQAIILLNRRGYATFVLCRECGHVLKCEHCSTSLVYHASSNILRCHYCRSTEAVPDICPNCGSRYIRYFGSGTQKLEEEMAKLWPGLRMIRMDQDTTHGKMSHANIINDFADGKYDVLLGTQMVAKGHDIKNVTAVGIISIDTSLNLPDFRAAERTFSLLTQAAGRAGRGSKPGKVIVQTYNPDHYAIQAGRHHDYAALYQNEIEFRRELDYPPFSQLIKLTVLSPDERKARHRADQLALQLQAKLSRCAEIIGPFGAAIQKVKDIYRMNILIKTVHLEQVRNGMKFLDLATCPDVIIDIEPVNVI
jgi:primosomal protein N' (replication factor Y)